MIKTYLYDGEADVMRHDVELSEVPEWLRKPNSLLWIDIYNWLPDQPQELQAVAELFGFHPLAVEDCIHESPRSKVDSYDGYDFFELHALKYEENGEPEISIEELNVFLGKNFIITVHRHAVASIGRIAARSRHDSAYMNRGADYLLYAIMDGITDTYFPIMDRLSTRIDELEDEMYEHPALAITEEFLALKRTIVLIRKAIEPQRRIFANVNTSYSFRVSPANKPYYMDLADHLERISDSIEVFRDLVQGALDTYSLLGTAKTNETIRVLTIITTLTATLTFVTGIFGMNVPLPFQHSWITTVMVFIGMGLLTIWMLAEFRRRKWI
ncbi:MAG: magnesium transporter CorA family protein [Alicyclobacillus sp.]|nr:magnesium transporter CorA family protein [Alicyclobacillus sp.]